MLSPCHFPAHAIETNCWIGGLKRHFAGLTGHAGDRGKQSQPSSTRMPPPFIGNRPQGSTRAELQAQQHIYPAGQGGSNSTATSVSSAHCLIRASAGSHAYRYRSRQSGSARALRKLLLAALLFQFSHKITLPAIPQAFPASARLENMHAPRQARSRSLKHCLCQRDLTILQDCYSSLFLLFLFQNSNEAHCLR